MPPEQPCHSESEYAILKKNMMRNRTRFIVLTIISAANGAICQGGAILQSGSNNIKVSQDTSDSSFSNGQIWKVNWPDGSINTFTVPEVTQEMGSLKIFESTVKIKGKSLPIRFYSDSNTKGSLTEIEFGSLVGKMSSKVCANFGRDSIMVGKTINGFFSNNPTSPEVLAYISGKTLSGYKVCKMIRIK
ncbi:hypothetical protein [Deinococcus sp.]|uniref:hypothetical protein n=1 Tax=Deinococcus sp. TaxID=47478 RepID=UPI003C7A62CC